MRFISIFSVLLAFILSAAHFLRNGHPDAALFCLPAFLLVFVKKNWVPSVVRFILLFFSLAWLLKAHEIYLIRSSHGVPWLRAVLILVLVFLFVRFCAGLVAKPFFMQAYGNFFSAAPRWAFVVVFAVLAFARLKPGLPVTMHERFFPLFSWVGIFCFALYAAFLTDKILQSDSIQKIRFRMWLGFSLVFFSQLILGLTVNPLFLMTGELHYPVPALVLFGSWIRGGGYFMLGLFLFSLLLLGPAWCSYLCYIGSFDLAAALRRKKIKPLPQGFAFKWRTGVFLIFVILISGLKFYGVGSEKIISIVAVAGVVGFVFFVVFSLRSGLMFHCTSFCPLGYAALILGRLHPFRIRLRSNCSSCGICAVKCRYAALPSQAFSQGRPDFNCTLCGDCVSPCPQNSIHYVFWGFSPENSRRIFLTAAVVLHTLFLATGRV